MVIEYVFMPIIATDTYRFYSVWRARRFLNSSMGNPAGVPSAHVQYAQMDMISHF